MCGPNLGEAVANATAQQKGFQNYSQMLDSTKPKQAAGVNAPAAQPTSEGAAAQVPGRIRRRSDAALSIPSGTASGIVGGPGIQVPR